MQHLAWRLIVFLLALGVFPAYVRAQTATYHLHKEASSTSGLFQLKTAGPDGTSLAIQSSDLKNQAAGEYLVKAFDTQSGVPNASGVIPAGTTLTYTLWMKKTANFGAMVPRAKVFLNSTAGTLLCTATGATALTTTLTKYTLTCTTSSAITMTTSNRFYLWVGVNLTTGPGNNTVKAEVDVEGTLNGNFDSLIIVPLPVPQPNITGLSPSSGPVSQSVTISGTNFGASQGTSTIKFNGTTATPTSWSVTSIAAPVPVGATNGSVVVTVSGVASNGVNFTVITTGTITGTITRASDAAPISGALIEALQSNVIKGSDTSTASGTYSITNLTAGTYDVRVSATGYVTDLKTGKTVAAGGTTTVNAALTITPGTFSGKVTKTDGTTAIAGAIVKVYQNTTVVATATANGTGDYSANVPPGTYSLEAAAVGYEAQSRSALVVSSGTTATANFSLATAKITYAYDELGRLVGVTDPGGDTAIYKYDAVGNLLSITRQNSSLPAIIEFTPNGGAVGTAVTISATTLSPTLGFNTVKFNGVTATVTAVNAHQITALVPAGATTGPITLITPAGTAVSVSNFTVGTPPGWPNITGVSPTIGNVGTTVTLTGTDFEPITTNNKVSFNYGVRSEVTAATATSITTSVPDDSSSGRLTVVTPSGEATSAGDFFVVPSAYTVAAVDVAARMVVGETRSVTISTVNHIALLVFDGTAGQKIGLNFTGVNFGTSECCGFFVSVSTMGTPTPLVGTDGRFLELPPLPTTRTYTIMIIPNGANTGTFTLSLLNIPPDVTGSISANGTPLNVAILTTGQNAGITFNATAGQRVSINITGVTIGTSFCCEATVRIKKPDSSVLFENTDVGTDGLFIETLSLPTTGTYTIYIDPIEANTGNATLQLYDVPSDLNLTITPGGPTVNATISASGQAANLTFNGTAGQRISLLMISTLTGGTGFQKAVLNLYKPDGSALVLYSIDFDDNYLLAIPLPSTGAYRIFLDPKNSYTGNVAFTLYDVPADTTTSITAGGAVVTVTTTTPGQKAKATFSATAGQRVSVKMSSVTMTNAFISILNPDGSERIGGIPFGTSGLFLDPVQLFDSGTYTIVIEGGLTNSHTIATGSVTLNLYTVPADTSGTVTIGGAAVPVTITVPGQNGQLTFNGTSGQMVTVHVTDNTMGSVTVSLIAPNGSTITSSTSSSASFNLTKKTLTATGTHTVKIDPSGANTGSLSISVSSP